MANTRSCWFAVLALLMAGCNRQDTEALKRIGKTVRARAEAVTGEIRSSATTSWHAIGDFGVEVRVAARLRWDKELADAAIEVSHLGTGVELRGKVRNFDQRRRAVMLAESTAGVEGVKDSMEQSDQ